MNKKLYRSQDNQMIGGVCAGIGEYFDIDPSIIRLIFVLFLLTEGFSLMLYIILWIILPVKSSVDEDSGEIIEENKKEIKTKVKNVTDSFRKDVSSDTKKKASKSK